MNGRPSHASSRVKSLGLRCATIREGANRGLRNSERVNTVGVLILTCGERESRDLWTTLNITWHSVKGVALTSLPPSTETRSCLTTLTTLAFYRNGRTSLNWNTSPGPRSTSSFSDIYLGYRFRSTEFSREDDWLATMIVKRIKLLIWERKFGRRESDMIRDQRCEWTRLLRSRIHSGRENCRPMVENPCLRESYW